MTNITLSIDDQVYNRMKFYSEIKWSEFVRKAIQQRIQQLDNINIEDESVLTMLASQNTLKKDWDNEEDEFWNTV